MVATQKRLLVVDDQILFTDLLQQNLETDDQFSVTTTMDMASAVDIATAKADTTFDIALLERDLTDAPTVKTVGHFARLVAPAKVVLFSKQASFDFIESCVQLGTFGFIPKTLSLNAFTSVLNFIASGQVFIPASFKSSHMTGGESGDALLTSGEMSVLVKIAQGLSNKQIAGVLDVQESTVKMRVRALFKKLGAANRTQALINAQRQRLLPQA